MTPALIHALWDLETALEPLVGPRAQKARRAITRVLEAHYGDLDRANQARVDDFEAKQRARDEKKKATAGRATTGQ